MYEQISDELIKQTIGKYDELTREIHEELKRICKVFSRQLDEADLIEAASIPGRDDVITGSAGGRRPFRVRRPLSARRDPRR